MPDGDRSPGAVVPPGPPGTSGEWRCTRTGTGLTAGFHDTRGVLRGFVLLGHEAQAQRGAWLNSCHDGQRAVA